MPPRQTFRNVMRQIDVQPGGCWLWTGSIKPEGYGQVTVNRKRRDVHRYVYEVLVGPVPEGLDLGHVCHDEDTDCRLGNACPHRRCANISHMRPMTRTENSLAGRKHT